MIASYLLCVIVRVKMPQCSPIIEKMLLLHPGGGMAQLVECWASNQKVVKPWFDSRCDNT